MSEKNCCSYENLPHAPFEPVAGGPVWTCVHHSLVVVAVIYFTVGLFDAGINDPVTSVDTKFVDSLTLPDMYYCFSSTFLESQHIYMYSTSTAMSTSEVVLVDESLLTDKIQWDVFRGKSKSATEGLQLGFTKNTPPALLKSFTAIEVNPIWDNGFDEQGGAIFHDASGNRVNATVDFSHENEDGSRCRYLYKDSKGVEHDYHGPLFERCRKPDELPRHEYADKLASIIEKQLDAEYTDGHPQICLYLPMKEGAAQVRAKPALPNLFWMYKFSSDSSYEAFFDNDRKGSGQIGGVTYFMESGKKPYKCTDDDTCEITATAAPPTDFGTSSISYLSMKMLKDWRGSSIFTWFFGDVPWQTNYGHSMWSSPIFKKHKQNVQYDYDYEGDDDPDHTGQLSKPKDGTKAGLKTDAYRWDFRFRLERSWTALDPQIQRFGTVMGDYHVTETVIRFKRVAEITATIGGNWSFAMLCVGLLFVQTGHIHKTRRKELVMFRYFSPREGSRGFKHLMKAGAFMKGEDDIGDHEKNKKDSDNADAEKVVVM